MEEILVCDTNSDSSVTNNIIREETSGRQISAARGYPPPPPPLLQVIKYVIPSLLALLPLKHRGADTPIFVNSPITLWCFLAATCAYWLIVEQILKQNETTREENPRKLCQMMTLDRAAIASGLLSLISLLSNFLPRGASLSLLVIWALLVLVFTWPLLKHAYNLQLLRTASADILGWVKGCCRDRETTLPVYINKNNAPTVS